MTWLKMSPTMAQLLNDNGVAGGNHAIAPNITGACNHLNPL